MVKVNLKNSADVQGDVQDIKGGPANEEDQTDSNQDVICPSSSRHLPYHADVGCFVTGFDNWKRLEDFVVDEANYEAWNEVLEKKTSDGVDEVVVDMRPVLKIVEDQF